MSHYPVLSLVYSLEIMSLVVIIINYVRVSYINFISMTCTPSLSQDTAQKGMTCIRIYVVKIQQVLSRVKFSNSNKIVISYVKTVTRLIKNLSGKVVTRAG